MSRVSEDQAALQGRLCRGLGQRRAYRERQGHGCALSYGLTWAETTAQEWVTVRVRMGVRVRPSDG